MNNDYWSWILAVVGLAGFILAGRKIWWSWYINIAAQFLWISYGIITRQYGFIFSAIVYAIVFGYNSYNWTKDYVAKKNEASQRALAHAKEVQKIIDKVNEGYIPVDGIPDLKKALGFKDPDEHVR